MKKILGYGAGFFRPQEKEMNQRSIIEKIKIFFQLGLVYMGTYGLQQLILVSAILAIIFLGSIVYLLFTGSVEVITSYMVIVACASTVLTVAATLLYRHLNPPLLKSSRK